MAHTSNAAIGIAYLNAGDEADAIGKMGNTAEQTHEE
jgi:hypothetical protein